MTNDEWRIMEYFLKCILESCPDKSDDATHENKEYKDFDKVWSRKKNILKSKDDRNIESNNERKINISLTKSFFLDLES